MCLNKEDVHEDTASTERSVISIKAFLVTAELQLSQAAYIISLRTGVAMSH